MDDLIVDDPIRPPGRPKGMGRIASKITLVATVSYRQWARDLADSIGTVEVSDAVRAGLRLLAESHGFRPPPSPR